MIKKEFGLAVRYYREKLGISQEELANRCGLHRTYISDIERGNRNVSLENIEAVSKGLNITLVDLFSQISRQQKNNKNRN